MFLDKSELKLGWEVPFQKVFATFERFPPVVVITQELQGEKNCSAPKQSSQEEAFLRSVHFDSIKVSQLIC